MPWRPILSPVSAGALVPQPNSRFKVPDGLAVLFPAGSACQRKCSLTAAPVPLLNAEAVNVVGCEFFPAGAVAALGAGILRLPRTVSLPFTSGVAPGGLVLMPTLCVLPLSDCNSN